MTERESSPVLKTLEEYRNGYKKKKGQNKQFHAINRLTVITLGASIPVLTTIEAASWITALVGAAVVVVSGTAQVFTPHERYRAFRKAYKDLESERILFLGKADPYGADSDADAVLAKKTAQIIADTEASIVPEPTR